MEQLKEIMRCPCCKTEITLQDNLPVVLPCKDIICTGCFETAKSKSENIDGFINIECSVCHRN